MSNPQPWSGVLSRLDDILYILSSPRSWHHKCKLYRQLQRQKRLAKQGVLDDYPFQDFGFRVLNPQLAPTLYTEIFLAEPYFFQTDKESPLIIDGGVHIGASIAYFKWLYPNSRIIGFEPHPAVYEVAKDNIERNQMKDVRLVNAALASVDGKAELYAIENDKSSTLTRRLFIKGLNPESVVVDTVRLSNYLDEKVDFLKLDIEGTEQFVLEEIEGCLGLVDRMFIEFHYTYGDDSNRLAPLLALLDRNDFLYLLMSSIPARRLAAVASLSKCGRTSALSIFAKRPGL